MNVRFVDDTGEWLETWHSYNGVIPIPNDIVTIHPDSVSRSYKVKERLLTQCENEINVVLINL